MAKHYFLCDEVAELLCNKFVVIIGDSVQRGIYKDLVLILQKNRYLSPENLKNKGEISFEGDILVEGGRMGRMTNGTCYREVRQYQTDHHLIRFYFVTRCYSKYMRSILADLGNKPHPDIVIMNSCLWDMTRYGLTAIDIYKHNLERLFARLPEVVPQSCLVIWNTTLPISKDARGGFLVKEVDFLKGSLRLDILEANYYAAHKAMKMNWDVLDLHYYLRYEMLRRALDGVHWDMVAHRIITNLILSHIADAWGAEFPSSQRHRHISTDEKKVSTVELNQKHKDTKRNEKFKSDLGPAGSNVCHRFSNENLLYGIQNVVPNINNAASLVPNRYVPSNASYFQVPDNLFENCYQMQDWRRNGVCRAKATASNTRYGPYGDKRPR